MSEPYLFPMEFSGDPCRKMMVEVVLGSGYCGRGWESDKGKCLLYEKKKEKQMSGRPSEWWYLWDVWVGGVGSVGSHVWLPPLLVFLYSWIELGRYKRCKVGSFGLGKIKGKKRKKKKKKKKKKREMGWVGLGVGQGANKYIKRIEYI